MADLPTRSASTTASRFAHIRAILEQAEALAQMETDAIAPAADMAANIARTLASDLLFAEMPPFRKPLLRAAKRQHGDHQFSPLGEVFHHLPNQDFTGYALRDDGTLWTTYTARPFFSYDNAYGFRPVDLNSLDAVELEKLLSVLDETLARVEKKIADRAMSRVDSSLRLSRRYR